MAHKPFIIVFICIILICAAMTIFISNNGSGSIATISADGKILHEIDLDKVKSSYEIPVEQDGKHNVVLVENGSISMLSADCPDKLCVKQGAISHSGYPIVCLPNKVIIEVK